VSLVSPADALWRLGSYDLQPQIMRNGTAFVFSIASVPSSLVVWWAAGFMIVTLAWAVRSFNARQL
jgi:hypothetical protein